MVGKNTNREILGGLMQNTWVSVGLTPQGLLSYRHILTIKSAVSGSHMAAANGVSHTDR